MFCRSCGASVRDGVKFCAQCGAAMPESPITGQPGLEPVVTRPTAPMPEVTPVTAATVANPPKTRKRWIAPTVIAIVVLALVAGGVVAWRLGMVGKQESVSSQSAKNPTSIDDAAAEPASDDTVDQASADPAAAPTTAKPLALGTPERAAVMDAIHLWRGTTKAAEPFYVNRGTQIFIQGEYVVCDLATSPEGANRMFMVVKGTPWKVVWSTPAESAGTGGTELKQAVPDIPADILSEIDWGLDWSAKK